MNDDTLKAALAAAKRFVTAGEMVLKTLPYSATARLSENSLEASRQRRRYDHQRTRTS